MAMRRLGPAWQGGVIWVMHVSICRTDARAIAAPDIAATVGALLVRVYDPVGNLRAAPAEAYAPSDKTTAEVR
jgi:hypothetical protein